MGKSVLYRPSSEREKDMAEEKKKLEEMNIWERLVEVQTLLKSPKDRDNSFGGFKYRSAEDILEAAKPLLSMYGLLLTITDEIKPIGDRFYLQALCTLRCVSRPGDPTITTTGFAREQTSKAKMDESQVTGASSSYARKYALNGLFLIDNSENDPDATSGKPEDGENKPRNVQKSSPKETAVEEKKPSQKLSQKLVNELEVLVAKTHTDVKQMLSYYKVERIEDLTPINAAKAINLLKKKLSSEMYGIEK